MTQLSMFTDLDLLEELERRRQEKKPKPEPLQTHSWATVEGLCEQYVNDLDEKGWVDDDLKHYIFEAAITAVFGHTVWEWIREKQQ